MIFKIQEFKYYNVAHNIRVKQIPEEEFRIWDQGNCEAKIKPHDNLKICNLVCDFKLNSHSYISPDKPNSMFTYFEQGTHSVETYTRVFLSPFLYSCCH